MATGQLGEVRGGPSGRLGSGTLRPGSDSLAGKCCPQQRVPCVTCSCTRPQRVIPGVSDDIIPSSLHMHFKTKVCPQYAWLGLGRIRVWNPGLWKGVKAKISETAPNRSWAPGATDFRLFPTTSVRRSQPPGEKHRMMSLHAGATCRGMSVFAVSAPNGRTNGLARSLGSRSSCLGLTKAPLLTRSVTLGKSPYLFLCLSFFPQK